MFSLPVSTLLSAIFILFYHVKSRFRVNDLLRNRIREKRINTQKSNDTKAKSYLDETLEDDDRREALAKQNENLRELNVKLTSETFLMSLSTVL